MTYTYDDDNISFTYQIIQKKQIKHSYIRITKDSIIVTANKRRSIDYLHKFVASKSNWISKHINKSEKLSKLSLLDEDAYIYLLGIEYKIKISIYPNIKKETLELIDNIMYFKLNTTIEHDRLIALRDNYYKSKCPTIITPIVEKYSQYMNLQPNKIGYRHTKTRWGSCSSKNNISLNTRLMMLPTPLIEYIVIHELAHIKHKNHSKIFWNLVEMYEPDWKSKRGEIRGFERLL